MANSDAPRGLMPARYVSGGYYDGAVNKYFVPASDGNAIYKGGLVKFAGDADADGIPTVTGNVATGDAVVGVVVAVEPVDRSSTIYREASTDRYVMVADSPDILFECQEDGAMTSAEVGNVADLTGFTAGNATTGLSSMEISSATATAAGDGTEDVLIVRLAQREDNEIGTNANWLVRLNNHAFVDGNTGA
ncbi:MAG: hypothetical protein AAF438_16955 [Pseudomonadota bacterium]